jgi:DNA-binding response OmpR family regulator
MKKVLIVDDSLEYLKFLTLFLVNSKRQIYSATSGRDALKVLESKRVDLIISDLQMPDGDGLWLLNEIKVRNINIPIIILSSDTVVSEIQLQNAGALKFFSKPIDLSLFENFLNLNNF